MSTASSLRNFWAFGVVVLAASTLVVLHAHHQKPQFYSMCIYILRSGACLAVLVVFLLYCMFLLAYLAKTILFGELRLIESEHLHEYGWMTISESFLAMTIFRDEFDSKFVLMFTALLLVKGFHWILRDRIEYMEQTPRLPPFFHPRIWTTVYILGSINFIIVIRSIISIVKHGPSLAIYFANEFALSTISLASSTVRYILNWRDLRRGQPWESRSTFLFYLDFVIDLCKLVIYLSFFIVVVIYYGLPLHIIRDLYMTIRSFATRIQDIVRYRRATRNMEQRYPQVTEQELAAAPDRICIICREDMSIDARKLPCGHFFHFKCLRSWLERQQACPTCRRPVLDDDRNDTSSPNAANPPHQQEGAPRVVAEEGFGQANRPANQQHIVRLPNMDARGGEGAFNLQQGNQLVLFPPLLHTGIPPTTGLAMPTTSSFLGPVGAVPIILIPPDQIAMINEREMANQDQARDIPPRSHSADPLINRRRQQFSLDSSREGLHAADSQPMVSTFNDSKDESNDKGSSSKPKFMLKQTAPGQAPIYLEKINFPFAAKHVSGSLEQLGSYSGTTISVRDQLSTQIQTSHLSDTELELIKGRSRESLAMQVQILTRLQAELDTLTNAISQVEEVIATTTAQSTINPTAAPTKSVINSCARIESSLEQLARAKEYDSNNDNGAGNDNNGVGNDNGASSDNNDPLKKTDQQVRRKDYGANKDQQVPYKQCSGHSSSRNDLDDNSLDHNDTDDKGKERLQA